MRIFEGLQDTPIGKVGRKIETYTTRAGYKRQEFKWEAHFYDEAGNIEFVHLMITLEAEPPAKRAWNGVTYNLDGYEVQTMKAWYRRAA